MTALAAQRDSFGDAMVALCDAELGWLDRALARLSTSAPK